MLDEGVLGAGARLPPERELVKIFGVSRGTLRKALAELEAEGRIWRHVGQGTFVGARRRVESDAPGLMSTNPVEIMETRILLEPGITGLTAMRATSLELQEMAACIAEGEKAPDVATFERWDSRFHRLIAQSARNALLMRLFDAVNAGREDELWGRLKSVSVTLERRRIYLQQHRAIIDAIRDRDTGGAEAAMLEHLTAVRQHLLQR